MATDYNLQIVFTAIDKASKTIQGITNSIEKNSATLQNIGKSMVITGGVVTGAIGLMVKAASDEELAMKKLQIAVGNAGLSWTDNKQRIDEFLESIQKTTRYQDDEVARVLQRLLPYTNDLSKAMQGAKLATDLASSGMFDLQSSVRFVGMAMAGNIEMLGRYIPELRRGTDESFKHMTAAQKTEYALSLLQKRLCFLSYYKL